MNSLEDVINKITEIKPERSMILIAIDGFGGSGKTTVAKQLKERFPEAVIVEMDDFYSPTLKRADYLRVLNQVIKPIKSGQTANYQIYEWNNDKYTDAKPIEPTGIIIIEGIFSLAKELIDNYDIKIWVDYPQQLGIERGIKRDGEGIRNMWVEEWSPKEKEYKDTQHPDKKADFIIDGANVD